MKGAALDVADAIDREHDLAGELRAFLEDRQLFANLPRIRHLPCAIVQGRYDVVCPIETAYELAQAWPQAEYVVVPDAGHSVREPGIARELVAAVERMKGRRLK